MSIQSASRQPLPTEGSIVHCESVHSAGSLLRQVGEYGWWFAIVALLSAVGCGRHDSHPIVLVAVEEVTRNHRAAEALGQPIARTTPVTGSASDTDGVAALQFDVKGSKGAGVVVVEGKRVGGEWGVTSLEIRMPGKADHLLLTGDLEARTGSDTPRFDPTAEKPSSPPPPPPTEIDIDLPPGPPGQ